MFKIVEIKPFCQLNTSNLSKKGCVVLLKLFRFDCGNCTSTKTRMTSIYKKPAILIFALLLQFSTSQISDFVATHEWQEIQEGQKVPAGLHYRMNLETGKKEAKILEDDNDSESSAVITNPNAGEILWWHFID